MARAMSKIKSLEQLVDHLSNESRIRKRELIAVRQMLPPATRAAVDFSLRLSPVMAYAHWEGYIKEAAKAYLLYLS
jgi:MAE_28990/MAE_18760-like HEPN